MFTLVCVLPEKAGLVLRSEDAPGYLAEKLLEYGGDGVNAVVLDVHQPALQGNK